MDRLPRGIGGDTKGTRMGGCHFPGVTPPGSCRPSVCPVTSTPVTLPHPGPTCTAWSPAAPGMTSCLCLSETDAGPYAQSEWVCVARGVVPGPPGWPLPPDHSPGSLQPLGRGCHAGGCPAPPGDTRLQRLPVSRQPLCQPSAHTASSLSVPGPSQSLCPAPGKQVRRAACGLSGGHGGCIRPSTFPDEGSAEAGCRGHRWGRAGRSLPSPRLEIRQGLLSLRIPSPAQSSLLRVGLGSC